MREGGVQGKEGERAVDGRERDQQLSRKQVKLEVNFCRVLNVLLKNLVRQQFDLPVKKAQERWPVSGEVAAMQR